MLFRSAGKVKLELAQFRELEAFTKFGSDLDEKTKQRIDRGYRTIEMLKQDQYASLSMETQVVLMWALTKGYLDQVEVSKVSLWEKEMINYLSVSGKEILQTIREKKDLDEELENKIKNLVEDFGAVFQDKNQE